MKTPYILLNKSLFFPQQGILAISDLHLGYEETLKTSGFEFPINQVKETKKDLEEIFAEIKKRKLKLKKIIILGDLKHIFGFGTAEKYAIRDILDFLEKHVKKENLILLKGNHERIHLDNRDYKFFHIEDNIAFLHGDKLFPEILKKDISTSVIGHLHPAVYIRDSKSHKKEKYKCFLVGKWKNKRVIVLPSFLQINQGTDIISEYKDKKAWAFIKKSSLLKFNAFVVGENKVYDFGILGKLK